MYSLYHRILWQKKWAGAENPDQGLYGEWDKIGALHHSFLSELKESHPRVKEAGRVRGDRGHQNNSTVNPLCRIHSDRKASIETADVSVPGAYGFKLSIFVGLLTVKANASLPLLLALGTLFLIWNTLVQNQYDGFCIILLNLALYCLAIVSWRSGIFWRENPERGRLVWGSGKWE